MLPHFQIARYTSLGRGKAHSVYYTADCNHRKLRNLHNCDKGLAQSLYINFKRQSIMSFQRVETINVITFENVSSLGSQHENR